MCVDQTHDQTSTRRRQAAGGRPDAIVIGATPALLQALQRLAVVLTARQEDRTATGIAARQGRAEARWEEMPQEGSGGAAAPIGE